MSGDNRSVSTDALETLGTIIGEGAGRDAIHIAVEPVIAGEKLYPGQDIGLDHGVAYGDTSKVCPVVEMVGIVDPFLTGPVHKDERFWLLVYPRQITSLRHVWSHPKFAEASGGVVLPPSKEASEAWLRDFIKRSDCPDYDIVIAAAVGGPLPTPAGWDPGDLRVRNDGDYLTFLGMDAHGEIPPEFWDHVEVVTGKTIPQFERPSYFSCSC